jgi:hypothetical protein
LNSQHDLWKNSVFASLADDARKMRGSSDSFDVAKCLEFKGLQIKFEIRYNFSRMIYEKVKQNR